MHSKPNPFFWPTANVGPNPLIWSSAKPNPIVNYLSQSLTVNFPSPTRNQPMLSPSHDPIQSKMNLAIQPKPNLDTTKSWGWVMYLTLDPYPAQVQTCLDQIQAQTFVSLVNSYLVQFFNLTHLLDPKTIPNLSSHLSEPKPNQL